MRGNYGKWQCARHFIKGNFAKLSPNFANKASKIARKAGPTSFGQKTFMA